MSKKAIVLDANILIRAVLGKRVRELIVDNGLPRVDRGCGLLWYRGRNLDL